MREYTVTMTYTVEAHDYDETVEIAKAVRESCADKHAAHGYKLCDVETQKIEEL